MNKTERLRLAAQESTLIKLGFASDEISALRRISNALRRWYELECGTDRGHIERDAETGRPYWGCPYSGRRTPVPDRETGALRRLARIMQNHAPLTYYIQTDPRGASLYILRPGDVPDGYQAETCYPHGIVIY